MKQDTPTVEEIVATYSDRAAKMFLSGTIPGAQWWLERMAEALTTYGTARYEEGVKAERERVREWAKEYKLVNQGSNPLPTEGGAVVDDLIEFLSDNQ